MITVKGIDPMMIAQNIEPHEPSHPGELLKEELECRGISQRRFAAATGIPYAALNEVLNSKRPVSTEYALLMEAALGISADMLLNMQQDYNKTMARRNASFMQRVQHIRKIAAVF